MPKITEEQCDYSRTVMDTQSVFDLVTNRKGKELPQDLQPQQSS